MRLSRTFIAIATVAALVAVGIGVLMHRHHHHVQPIVAETAADQTITVVVPFDDYKGTHSYTLPAGQLNYHLNGRPNLTFKITGQNYQPEDYALIAIESPNHDRYAVYPEYSLGLSFEVRSVGDCWGWCTASNKPKVKDFFTTLGPGKYDITVNGGWAVNEINISAGS